jgi:hypothetical protein
MSNVGLNGTKLTGVNNFPRLASPAMTLFFMNNKVPAIYFNSPARDEIITCNKFIVIDVNRSRRRIEFEFSNQPREGSLKINCWQSNTRIVFLPHPIFEEIGITPNKKRAFVLHRGSGTFSQSPTYFVDFSNVPVLNR